jgi:DNA-binding NtrC family response regulator
LRIFLRTGFGIVPQFVLLLFLYHMPKILLADDEEVLRSLLTIMLETDGHEVKAVVNGMEVLKAVVKEDVPFDLLITDLIMPEREGIETIMELRKKHPSLKIIAMSGGGRSGADGYLKLALKLGAAAILEKPFDRQELLDTVRKVLALAPNVGPK